MKAIARVTSGEDSTKPTPAAEAKALYLPNSLVEFNDVGINRASDLYTFDRIKENITEITAKVPVNIEINFLLSHRVLKSAL